jgi:hypothetical protein
MPVWSDTHESEHSLVRRVLEPIRWICSRAALDYPEGPPALRYLPPPSSPEPSHRRPAEPRSGPSGEYSRQSRVTLVCRGRSVAPSSSATARRQALQSPLAHGPAGDAARRRHDRRLDGPSIRQRNNHVASRHRRRRSEPSAPVQGCRLHLRHRRHRRLHLRRLHLRLHHHLRSPSPSGTVSRCGNGYRKGNVRRPKPHGGPSAGPPSDSRDPSTSATQPSRPGDRLLSLIIRAVGLPIRSLRRRGCRPLRVPVWSDTHEREHS